MLHLLNMNLIQNILYILLITYKNTGQFFGICPGSHKTMPYLYSNGFIIKF